MPVAYLNNAATQDTYVDALTVAFSRGRPRFSMNVNGAAIYYKLGVIPPTGRDIAWESTEHYLVPSLNTFTSPAAEGFPEGTLFAGIQIRSGALATPATVSII